MKIQQQERQNEPLLVKAKDIQRKIMTKQLSMKMLLLIRENRQHYQLSLKKIVVITTQFKVNTTQEEQAGLFRRNYSERVRSQLTSQPTNSAGKTKILVILLSNCLATAKYRLYC